MSRPLKFSDMKFEDIFAKLIEIGKWLDELAITRRERFDKATNMIGELIVEYYKAKANQEFDRSKNREMQNALFEAQPFLTIYDSFKDCRDDEFLRLLKVAVRGPEFSKDENAMSNEARNHLFAINLAARIKDRGLDVVGFKDININFENHQIAIQCKRPYSIERLEANINDAYEQMKTENSMTDDNNVRGIVAISVEKILGLDKNTFVFKTGQHIEEFIYREVDKLCDLHRTKWLHLMNINIFGIFFYFRFFAQVQDENDKVYTIDTPVLNLLISRDHPDAQLLLNLAVLLK